MKCIICGMENEIESKYCIICGIELNSDKNNVKIKDVYEDIIDNLTRQNNLTKLQKEKFHDKLIEMNIKTDFYPIALKILESEKNYYNTLNDDEYLKIHDMSIKNIINSFNNNGVDFKEYVGKERVSETILQNIEETVPITVNEHGDFSRSLTTAMFGLTGLASTSGVKTEFVSVAKQIPVQHSYEKDMINNLSISIKETGFYVKNTENDKRLIIPFAEIYDIGFDNEILYIATAHGTFSFTHRHNYYERVIESILNQRFKYKNITSIKENYFNKLILQIKNELIIYFKSLKKKETSEMEKINLIKEYYNLKVEGIISNEEFEEKKKELLN